MANSPFNISSILSKSGRFGSKKPELDDDGEGETAPKKSSKQAAAISEKKKGNPSGHSAAAINASKNLKKMIPTK